MAIPIDEYRWTNDGKTLQQKWITIAGPDYYGMQEGDDDMPVWTQDEALKGRLWRPVIVAWVDVPAEKQLS